MAPSPGQASPAGCLAFPPGSRRAGAGALLPPSRGAWMFPRQLIHGTSCGDGALPPHSPCAPGGPLPWPRGLALGEGGQATGQKASRAGALCAQGELGGREEAGEGEGAGRGDMADGWSFNSVAVGRGGF